MWVALMVSCLLLAAIYGGVAVYAIHQFVKVFQQDELSWTSFESWIPRTIQRQVQILVILLTVTRAAFFLVAIFAWDSSLGVVDQYRGAFYSLDELATIAFFTLACILALFWAEVYYIAIDQVTEYKYLVRPMTYAINVGAYVAVIGCAYAAVHASSSTSTYIYWNFSLLVSILFVLAALVFTFYAYKAAMEISSIPVHMSARQSRTEELSRIFSIFILSLLARAACLLLMSNDDLKTRTSLGIFLVTTYFILLELIPVVFAIVFYRTQYDASMSSSVYSNKNRYEDVGASYEEIQPLQYFSGDSEVDASYLHHLESTTAASGFGAYSRSPLGSATSTATTAAVAAGSVNTSFADTRQRRSVSNDSSSGSSYNENVDNPAVAALLRRLSSPPPSHHSNNNSAGNHHTNNNNNNSSSSNNNNHSIDNDNSEMERPIAKERSLMNYNHSRDTATTLTI